jgi:hypothetical protein
MWMNGTGAKQYMKADPYQEYYLVVDGFENISASLNFAVAPAVDLPSVCIGSTVPIILKDLRTVDPLPTDILYKRLTGSGGDFDETEGIFTPDQNTTDSEFEIATNKNTPEMTMTENITIMMVDCSVIPTLSQWLILMLSLFLVYYLPKSGWCIL